MAAAAAEGPNRTGFPNDPFPAGLACTHGRRAGYVVADDRLLRVRDLGDQPTDSTTKY